MIRILNTILITCTLFSCNLENSEQIETYKYLNDGIDLSNKTIKIYTTEENRTLLTKISDPSTSESARIWYQYATKVKKITNDLYFQLDSCMQNLSEKNFSKIKDIIVSQILQYKEKVGQINPEIYIAFREDLNKLADSNLSKTFAKKYISIEYKKLILNRLYNSVVLIENRLITFCNNHAGPGYILRYDRFSVLLGQNSKHLKSGDELEITAGIGSYTKAAQPKIEINNKEIDLNEYGYAQFKTAVEKIPGKYKIPVKIKYTAPNGEYKISNFEVDYTVD